MSATGFCPQCGNPRTGELRYCAKCGFDFWKAAAQQADPSAAQHTQQIAEPARTAVVETTTGTATSRRPRWRTGLVWGVGAFVALAVIGTVLGNPNEEGAPAGATSSSTATVEVTPEPTASPAARATQRPTSNPTPRSTPQPTPRPIAYRTLANRAWQLLVKSPDDYTGKGYVVWACITQFDAATGDETFRGQAANRNVDYWYSDGDNSLFTANASKLRKFVQDDVVKMNVVSLGSFSYDTQIGGNTTVPLFEVDKIQRVGSCS